MQAKMDVKRNSVSTDQGTDKASAGPACTAWQVETETASAVKDISDSRRGSYNVTCGVVD